MHFVDVTVLWEDATEMFSLLAQVGRKGWSLKQAVKNMADNLANSSEWLWIKRKVCDWGGHR